MPVLKEYHLTWRRRVQGELKDPDKWNNVGRSKTTGQEPKWEDYVHIPRRLWYSVLYFANGEYVDPIVSKPIKQGVVDVIQRERGVSKSGVLGQRIEVKRQTFLQKNPTDRWSPIDKFNTLMKNRSRILYECEYDYLNNDRSLWYPVWRSFIMSHPLMIYDRHGNDMERLYLQNFSRLSFETDAKNTEVSRILPVDEDWSYPGLLPGMKPPESISAKSLRVGYETADEKKGTKIKIVSDKQGLDLVIQTSFHLRKKPKAR